MRKDFFGQTNDRIELVNLINSYNNKHENDIVKIYNKFIRSYSKIIIKNKISATDADEYKNRILSIAKKDIPEDLYNQLIKVLLQMHESILYLMRFYT